MESPFTDYTGLGDLRNEEYFNFEGFVLESPFVDAGYAQREKDETYESEHLVSEEVRKTGDAVLTVADPATAASEEYREPAPSGNVLLVVKSGDRQLHISTQFTVGEYARAQSGKYKFNFIRIDPVLVDNLQRLRTFLGKPLAIIDGYYTTRYLKEVLAIKDNQRISLNPHIAGRAVKITVDGYRGMIKQLAIAAIVTCDRDINLGIGESTMTLYVKQGLSLPVSVRAEDFQRITSYISDEKIKVAAYTFCVDVKRILYTYNSVYEQAMKRAVSAFAAIILKIHYKQDNIPGKWMDWEEPLGDVVALMQSKSKTGDPNVILYCIAYSPFGNLYRNFLKSRTESQTVDFMINDLTTANDRTNRNNRGSFLALQNEPDKTSFIDNCRQRIVVGMRSDGTRYHLAPVTFFDWKDHPQDRIFKDKMSQFIKEVYFQRNLIYDIPAQQSPVGGTHSNPKQSPRDPDKPVMDFTGRYWAQFEPDHETLYGRYVLINQAGNYISGKLCGIFKKPVKNLRNTITEFYGKVDENGNAICTVYPKYTLKLVREQNIIRLYLINNADNKTELRVPLVSRSKMPVISNQIINSFSKINEKYQDLLLTLAWVQPPPDQLKTFFDSFKISEAEVKEAIKGYYDVDETRPSLKQSGLQKYFSRLDTAINNYLKLPPMFQAFSNYYIKYYYSFAPHWSHRNDQDTRSLLSWIKKMMEDFRDFRGTAYVEKQHQRLYDYFGVDTKIPDVKYKYELKIKLTSFGLGPFARSSGTITIFNKTDDKKLPKDSGWTQIDYPIVVWNATLSLNPLSLLPKVAAGQTIEAGIITNTPYSDKDFSGADIQITEGKVFELPLSGESGGVKVSTKAGIGGMVILIDGQGKKTLEFIKDLDFSLPDTVEIEPSVSSAPEGTYEKIAQYLPSLTMYRGSIGTKKTTEDISSVPLPDQFAAFYQLKDTRYFIHDSAALTAQAIEAIGRLCAEELVGFSDPASQIEIYGHADASGKPGYNLTLSKTRAINVRHAIEDRLGTKLKAEVKKVEGLGESEANTIYGEYTQKNAWLRRVVVIINGRAVLSLGE